MPENNEEITDLQETSTVIRCQTQCGCVQYLVAPPDVLMESFTLPAGHSRTMGLDGQPKPMMRMFGYVGTSDMTGDKGEKITILNYREGATPVQRPGAIQLVQ